MTDNYDNGYNSSDFKRNSNQEAPSAEQDGEDAPKMNEKAGEYMRELLSEKIKLNTGKFPVACSLIDQEVTKVQASGRTPARDSKYLDVMREKPVKVTVKVLVPVKEHPKFNFVGKLLGPKGNTMKFLQEETMCKMAILGRGSIRDKQKEQEYRTSLDPKYAHLSDELHVEISALAPPAEAHARIAYALAEVKKYLVPDPAGPDMMGPNPGRDMMDYHDGGAWYGARPPPLLRTPNSIQYKDCTLTERSMSYQHPVVEGPPRSGPPGRMPPRMPPAPPMLARPMPPKTKVISILDRARNAMETAPYGYDDPYGAPEQVHPRGPPRGAPEPDFYYERSNDRFYEDQPSYYKDESREYKASARDVGTRRQGGRQQYAGHRASPYARPK